MADSIKVLGQLDPSATTTTVLYTVPAETATTVSSIVAANVAGAGADDKQYLYYDKSVAANDSLTIVIGITLNQTDVVKVYTSGSNMSFNIFGVETTND